jgi:peptidoglycan/xylan/chitin deacetylase (PgdA/CDA1 family)
MRHTDPKRDVQPELFERVYDRSVNRLLAAQPVGDWWLVDVAANRDRLVAPVVQNEALELGPTICVCHDIEAGLGHEGIDEHLARRANESWRKSVAAMLQHERDAGIRATYSVVGRLLADVRPEIEADGHCVAFHSYDHRIDQAEQGSLLARTAQRLRGRLGAPAGGPADAVDQLAACREIDYRIKGYRVPQSKITADLSDANLLFQNFEWVASSAFSLGTAEPALRAGIVWIPVHIDEFGLYRDDVDFAGWKAQAVEAAKAHGVAVVSLHDCYAHLWLDGYGGLLESLGALGEFRTLDEVAATVTLAASV